MSYIAKLANPVSAGAAPPGTVFVSLAEGEVAAGIGGGNVAAQTLSQLASLLGMTITGQQLSLTPYTGTITAIDWNHGNEQLVTLANGASAASLVNPEDGAHYRLRVRQPNAGTAGTITWPSGMDGVTFQTGSASLSLVNGAVNLVDLQYVYADRQYYANIIAIPATDPYAVFFDGTVNYTDKLTYSTGTVTSGTALSTQRNTAAAVGNSVLQIIGGGGPSTTTDKWLNATGTLGTGNAPLATSQAQMSATGTSAQGYFAHGSVAPGGTLIQTYDYATDVCANAAFALANNVYWSSAGGNPSVGYWFGGFQSSVVATVEKLPYSTFVVAAGHVLTSPCMGSACASNPTDCAVAGGSPDGGSNLNTLGMYHFADDSYAVNGHNLTFAARFLGGTGNSVEAVFGAGFPDSTTTNIMPYATMTPVAGNALGAARHYLTASTTSGSNGT